MKFNINQAIIAAFVSCLIIAPLFWMALDRDPPYIRESGEVVPADPAECGLLGESDSVINPGDCVTVKWRIAARRNCVPNTPNNVTRRIQDSEKVLHTIAPSKGVIGTTPKIPSQLNRHFQIPSGAASGRALYKSTACFACNPMQRFFWPICISMPDVEFDIHPSTERFKPRARLRQ